MSDPVEPIAAPRTNAPSMRNRVPVARVVLVLAKAPVAGRAKTRLIPAATPEGAAGIAAAALLDTLDAAAAVPGARVVVALEGDPRAGERADEIVAALADTVVVPQRGHTLGERITAAHHDVAAAYPDAATVQIGMDTPQVDAGLLGDALDVVTGPQGADAALGLALDGGWWALALADPRDAGVIADVPTSRDDTGPRTLATLRAAHDRVLELPPLSDVDTPGDAVAVAGLVPAGRFARAVADLLPAARSSAPVGVVPAPLRLPVPGGLPR